MFVCSGILVTHNNIRCHGGRRCRSTGHAIATLTAVSGRHGDVPGLRCSREIAVAHRAPKHRRAGVCGVGCDGAIGLLDMRRLQRGSRPGPDMSMTSARGVRLLRWPHSPCSPSAGHAVGAFSFAAADRRQVATRTGIAGAATAHRTARGVRGRDHANPERAEAPAQLADLDLPQVWQLTRGAGQRVAVIDTGVSRHRRLPELVAGGDYAFTGDGTQDCDAHGTLVAGIIAAAPDPKADRFSGVAPDVTVISIRQSSAKFAPVSDRSGTGVGDVDTMAKAVRTAADLGASVINISSVACVPAATALDDRALGAALAYAVDVKNAVIVAAAGNTGRCRAMSTSALRREPGTP